MGLTPLATGFCFGEGPRWFEGLLWFSDMLGEAVHTVTLGGSMTTLPLPGHAPSGLGFRPDGSLLIVSTEGPSTAALRRRNRRHRRRSERSGAGRPRRHGRRRPRACLHRVAGLPRRRHPASRSRRHGQRGGARPGLPQRHGHHARPADLDRRRVDRPAVDRVQHRRRRRSCPIDGSSPTAWTGRPTASAWTPPAGCGRR